MLRIGFTASLLLHAAILAWAVLELRSTKALEAPEVVPITIGMLDVSKDKQDLRKGSLKADDKPTKKIEETPKSVAKPEVKKEKVVALPPPKKEEPKVEPKEEPKKEEPKKAEPKKEEPPKEVVKEEKKAEPEKDVEPAVDPVAELLKQEEAAKAAEVKQAEAKKKEEAKKEEAKRAEKLAAEKKAEAKKKELQKVAAKAEKSPGKTNEKFDADKLSQLLNKIPDAAAKSNDETDEVAKADVEQKSIGGQKSKGQQLSVIEKNIWISKIREKLNRCWSPPAGGLGAENVAVPLRFELKPDGSIVGQPRVVSSNGDPLFQIASEAAVRALFQCEPYDMFPPDKYDLWKSWVLNFKPEPGGF